MAAPEQMQEVDIPIELERPQIIRTRELTKVFGGETAVDAITMHEPDAGEVSVLGARPARFTRRDRERIGYLPQLFVLYPDLTIWENMNFAASLYGVSFIRGKRLHQL